MGSPGRRGVVRAAGVVLVAAVLGASCSASGTAGEVEAPGSTAPVDDGSVVAAHAGEQWFLGEVPASGRSADESLAPIELGMINQESTPIGSYPEVRAAVEAAVSWVNAELGGVDGHPIELHTCITPFDADRSRACATELIDEGVVAFVGGVDVMSTASTPVIEQHGLVSIGGIPATLVQMRSPNEFFFSGGDAGAVAAFMAHAAAHGRAKVVLAYAQEVDSFAVAARDYGAAVGESLGLDVEVVPYSILDTDHRPLVVRAAERGADAVMVLAASTICASVMDATAELLPEAQLYLTGACASEAAGTAAGESAVGVLFNAEGRVDGVDVDASLFRDVVERYATGPAGGAGTVGFRGFMNLYALLVEAGADQATSDTLTRLASSSVGRPSFWGHPYTCDGNQVPGLPALCAPQEVLFALPALGQPFVGVTDWIPTDRLFVDALG